MTNKEINKLLEENIKWIQRQNAEWNQRQGDISPVTTHILETLNKILECQKLTAKALVNHIDLHSKI